MTKNIPLHPGVYYHIYNRGNNREDLFKKHENYSYFMDLYAKYIPPVAETYAYCLLRNHFHFLVRIKDEQDWQSCEDWQSLPQASQAFSNLFSTYTKAINKAYQRTGSLFEKPFKRIPITEDAKFIHLIAYIHYNPQLHGFVDDFRSWSYSSYNTLLSAKSTNLATAEVLDWFGGMDGFRAAHQEPPDHKKFAELAPDEVE
jgi:REP element-mobilizing transposase RayT